MPPPKPSTTGQSLFPLARTPVPEITSSDYDASLELSTTTLPSFLKAQNEFTESNPVAPTGRRRLMVIRDSDVILAAGKELRLSTLNEAKLLGSTSDSTYIVGGFSAILEVCYADQNNPKTLTSSAVDFHIHQISLNPTGKLLAVAGKHSVAVIVLPRSGFARRGKTALECK